MGGNTQNINKLREILEHEQLLHHKTRLLYSSIHMLNMTTPQDKTSLLLNSCFKQTRLLYSSIHMLNRDAPSAIDGQVVAARGQLVGGARGHSGLNGESGAHQQPRELAPPQRM